MVEKSISQELNDNNDQVVSVILAPGLRHHNSRHPHTRNPDTEVRWPVEAATCSWHPAIIAASYYLITSCQCNNSSSFNTYKNIDERKANVGSICDPKRPPASQGSLMNPASRLVIFTPAQTALPRNICTLTAESRHKCPAFVTLAPPTPFCMQQTLFVLYYTTNNCAWERDVSPFLRLASKGSKHNLLLLLL